MIHNSRIMVHSTAAAPPPARARVAALVSVQSRLVEAGRDIVSEQGWQGAQIALIAARAGVATGSVYRHFASKADLFAQVLADVSEREISVVEAIAAGTGPVERRLRDAVTTFMARALARRRLAYALIAEPCEPEIDRERLVYRAALARVLQALITEGVAARRFRAPSAAVAASCVAGAMMEALVGPLAPDVAPDTRAADSLVRTTADHCLAMLRRS
jgi:AcrR family transcriptional regulator